MWFFRFENYGYVAAAFAQRQLLLSVLGFIGVVVITFCWRRASALSKFYAWCAFFAVVLLTSLIEPAFFQNDYLFNSALHGWRGDIQSWLPLRVLSPCELPFSERLSGELTLLPALSWNQLIFGVWVLAAGWKLMSFLSRRHRLSRVAKRGARVEHPVVMRTVDEWRRHYRLRRKVIVRASDGCDLVFTIGIVRPIIHLPARLLRQLSADDIDAVVGHELAHIKRCDDLFIRMQLVVKSFLFFNPVMWIGGHRIAALREYCCDQLALGAGRLSPQRYAKSLLRIAQMQARQGGDSEVAAGLISSTLTERVNGILQPAERRTTYWPALLVATMLLALNFVLMPDFTGGHIIRGTAAERLLRELHAVRPLPQRAPFGDFSGVATASCIAAPTRHYHPGVDFVPGKDRNAPVRAVADGEVSSVTRTPRYAGSVVQIRHADGIVSTYIHMGAVAVRAGDRVRAGQPIGALGANHLHFEMRKGTALIDPSAL